ncbi:hypothetical protein B0A55_10871 [Friedmanniomyces simplex]|uniref:Uncharacterized protein n=1 Tax=Friedmanniomyces simplex TaxID=329884 RepID=A0A4U0WR41_9PEZI|nr:hypothetical protein B0A55_10871 [Friedmanniomyces simplex]
MAGSSSNNGRMYGATFRATGPNYSQYAQGASQYAPPAQYQYASNQPSQHWQPAQAQTQRSNDSGYTTNQAYAQPSPTYPQASTSMQYGYGMPSGSYETSHAAPPPQSTSYSSQSWPFRPTPTEGYQNDPKPSVVTASSTVTQHIDAGEVSVSGYTGIQTSWHQGCYQPVSLNAHSAAQQSVEASLQAGEASRTDSTIQHAAAGHKRKRTGEHERRPASANHGPELSSLEAHRNQNARGERRQPPSGSLEVVSRPTRQEAPAPEVQGSPSQPPTKADEGSNHASSANLPADGPGPRAAWSIGPAYGRKRGPKGNRLPKTLEMSRNGGPTGTAAEFASQHSDEFLTGEQVSALQSASGAAQSSANSSAPQQQQPYAETPTQQNVNLPAVEEAPPTTTQTGAEEDDRPNTNARPPTPTEPVTSKDRFLRKNMHLPPVVGSYLHYSNKTVKYNPMVVGIDDIRQKLFELKVPVLLNSQQIADYWSHMTNVWMRSTKESLKGEGAWLEAWECRHRKRVTAKHKTKEGRGAWQSKRELLKESSPCSMRIRMAYYIRHADTDENHQGGIFMCRCLPEWMYLERSPRCTEAASHNHDIDMLDRFKRSDALMYFVKNKAEEGYSYSAVTHWLHDKYGSVTRQAQFVGKQEVANVSQRWRKANRHIELRLVVEEPTAEEVERKKCLDLVHSASNEGLTRALVAVCKR